MASLNECNFIGNLGKYPEVRYLPSGDAVANFSIACTEKWKDKDSGEMKEATEWIRVVCFGRKAEIAGEYLTKGSPVYVSCHARTREYTKDGQKRYTMEFVADKLILLGRGSGGGSGKEEAQAEAYADKPSGAGMPDDDIPFMQPFHGGLWRVV